MLLHRQKLYYRQIHLEILKENVLSPEGRRMPGEQGTEPEFQSLHLGFRGVCQVKGVPYQWWGSVLWAGSHGLSLRLHV